MKLSLSALNCRAEHSFGPGGHLETRNTSSDAAPPARGAGIPYSFIIVLYSLFSCGSAGQSGA